MWRKDLNILIHMPWYEREFAKVWQAFLVVFFALSDVNKKCLGRRCPSELYLYSRWHQGLLSFEYFVSLVHVVPVWICGTRWTMDETLIFPKSVRGGSSPNTVAVWPENSFSPLLTRPQGPQGCQMKRNHSLNMPLEVWCAKIDPKLNKLEKTIKIEKNSSKMSVFWRFFEFSSNWGQS